MREKKCKKLRRHIRQMGYGIGAEPYRRFESGMIIASIRRQRYQRTKKEIR